MKRTSFGSRLVRIAARSPARSSTGPDVWRRFTPISRAMMWASVVLPSPGGPKRSAWSRASLRARAAAMKMPSCSRIFAWPTYSASWRGRSARSSPSSRGEAGVAEMSRSASIMYARSRLREELQRLADRIGDLEAAGQLLHHGARLALIVAKAQQRVHHVGVVGRGLRARGGHHLGQLV